LSQGGASRKQGTNLTKNSSGKIDSQDDWDGTLNNKVVGNFISSLRRVGTKKFDIRRKEHEGLKLEGFLEMGLQI
jgi:hypothetical protein